MIEASNILKDVFPISYSSYALATSIETTLGISRFLSYYTDSAISNDETKKCTDFTARLLSYLADTKPNRKVFVYMPNRDFFGESFPSYSVSEMRKLGNRLSKINDFLSQISKILIENNIDFNFINDERLKNLSKHNFIDAVLVLPSKIDTPSGAEKFKNIIMGDNALKVANTLLDLGYANLKTEKPSKFISFHKKGQFNEMFLIVNIGDDYEGKITLNTDLKNKKAVIYDPFTDIEEDVSSPININIKKHKCKIIKLF